MNRNKKRRGPLRLQVGNDPKTSLQRARELWAELVHERTLVALTDHELWAVLREHSSGILEIESYALSEGHFCIERLLMDHFARERLKEFEAFLGPDFCVSALKAAQADWKRVFQERGITRAQRREYEMVRSQSQDWVQRVCQGSPQQTDTNGGAATMRTLRP